jgi:hypothetical protein
MLYRAPTREPEKKRGSVRKSSEKEKKASSRICRRNKRQNSWLGWNAIGAREVF